MMIIFIIIHNILQKKSLAEFENNPNIGNLYYDSVCEVITRIDNEGRSNHIILNNKMEYYFGIESSPRWRTLSTPLSKWIHAGDTLVKEKNEKVFYVHTTDGQVLGVHFSKPKRPIR